MTKQEFGVLDQPVNPIGETIVTWPAKDKYNEPHQGRKVLTLPVNHARGNEAKRTKSKQQTSSRRDRGIFEKIRGSGI